MLKHAVYLLFIPILILFGICEFANAQTLILNYFTITSDGADILIEWEIKDETNLTEFQLYRKLNDEPTLTFVTNVLPNGSLKYQFLDDGIFKNNGRIIQYELHVFIGNQVHKFTSIPLAHTPTSIQRTWGSIKSMFR